MLNTRAIATQLVYDVLYNKRSLSQSLPVFKNRCKTKQEAALVQALAFGVIRFFPRLEFIAQQLLEKPLKSKDIELLYLIAVGLYQLIDMDIKAHAALSETVEAAKQLGKAWGAGLVNAILRSYQRKSHTLQTAIQHNAVAYFAHPQWLIDIIKIQWPAEWENILMNNNTFPPLHLRVNVQKNSREQYFEHLKTDGLEAEAIPFTKTGIWLKSPLDIKTLPGFMEGAFSVQDGAAQLAGDLLELSAGLRVLDAAAAPGGKTSHILEIEPNVDHLVALDISESRTQLIRDNLKRLNLNATNVTVMTANAKDTHSWWDGRLFDRILLDAPCSSTGVIRRHPDIKYLRQPKDIHSLSTEQQQLLDALWPLLKSGGILLFATCSILSEENLMVMENFLNQHQDAIALPLSISCGIPQKIGHQILPGQNGMDGFYYAKIQKLGVQKVLQ